MSAKAIDTSFLAAGGLILAGAAAWAVLQQSRIASLETPTAVPTSGRAYEPSNLKVAVPESRRWADAPSQPAGAEWRFEVFTPPEIYYNVDTKQFTVIPPTIKKPSGPEVGPPPPPPFGLELVRVEQPLFRLQLVGALGEGANARGTFENTLTGDVFTASLTRKGPQWQALGLELIDFKSERRRVKVQGGTDVIETVIVATVKDTKTGEVIALDAKNRRPDGALRAVFRNPAGQEFTTKAGEKITDGGVTFEILDLQLSPAGATVKKSAVENEPEKTEKLSVPAPAAPKPAATKPSTPSPASTAFPGF